MDNHVSLWDKQFGKLKGLKADVIMESDASPVTSKPYKVPYALKQQIETELERPVKCGVLTPVTIGEWSISMVPIQKHDGSVRICWNCKTTVKPVLKHVAPPNIYVEDILAILAGGVTFTKLDLAHAYNQMVLTDEAEKFLTFSTHKGLYNQNRLVFGITSGPRYPGILS